MRCKQCVVWIIFFLCLVLLIFNCGLFSLWLDNNPFESKPNPLGYWANKQSINQSINQPVLENQTIHQTVEENPTSNKPVKENQTIYQLVEVKQKTEDTFIKSIESKQKFLQSPTINNWEVNTTLQLDPNSSASPPNNTLPKKRTNRRSVVFSDCTGRLGNQISTFAILLVFHKMYGFTPNLDKEQIKLLSRYFDNVNFSIFRGKIHKDLVPIKLDYQFDKLENKSYHTGYAINIGKYPHSLTLYQKYLSQINQELKLKKKYVDEAKKILSTISEKYSGSNVTFIGVHVRRDDYAKWMSKRLGKKTHYVTETYFKQGMDIFRQRVAGASVFVAVSDDETWIEKHLSHEENVHIGGTVLTTTSKDPSARDFALLSMCNHSLLSYGTFGQWAALRNGGQVILPAMTRKLSKEMIDPEVWAKANLTKWTFI